MMASLVRQGEGQARCSYPSMSHEAAIQSDMLSLAYAKRLGIGEQDAQIHVVENHRETPLKSSYQRARSPLGPWGIFRPQEPARYGRIE